MILVRKMREGGYHMSELILWTNREINKLRRDIDRLFERLWMGFGGGADLPGDMRGPYFELLDEGDTLVVNAELPGMRPKDVEISVREDMLFIRAEKRQAVETSGPFYRRVEQSFRSVSRRIKLPCRVKATDVRADYKAGVFRIVMPKIEMEKKKGIKIRVK